LGRRGTTVALLAPLRNELRRAGDSSDPAGRAGVAARPGALHALARHRAGTRPDDGALAGSAGFPAPGGAGPSPPRPRPAAVDHPGASPRRNAGCPEGGRRRPAARALADLAELDAV